MEIGTSVPGGESAIVISFGDPMDMRREARVEILQFVPLRIRRCKGNVADGLPHTRVGTTSSYRKNGWGVEKIQGAGGGGRGRIMRGYTGGKPL